MNTSQIRWIIPVIFAAATLAGCENADSASGVSQAEFNALKAQVEAMQSQAATVANAATRDQLVVRGVPVSALRALGKANAMAEGDVVFTVIAPIGPIAGSTKGAEAMEVMSTAAYSTDIPVGESQVAVEEPLIAWFLGADCSGTVYLRTAFNDYNSAQGYVFRVGDDPATASYWMIERDTVHQDNLVYGSRKLKGVACENGPFAEPFGYPAVANDALVTGIPSGVFGTSATLGPEPAPTP